MKQGQRYSAIHICSSLFFGCQASRSTAPVFALVTRLAYRCSQRLGSSRWGGNVPKVVESSFHKDLTVLNSHLVGP
jgi:hypothetical protein